MRKFYIGNVTPEANTIFVFGSNPEGRHGAGAAFVFKCIAKRNDPTRYGTPSTISTIQSAIQHCIKLLPFMEETEKIEHIKLINWLNELLVQKGENEVKIPKQFK